MGDVCVLSRDGESATLRLNRPDSRNALSIELIAGLREKVGELHADPPKALVITGEGGSFCAGMDLKQVLSGGDTPRELLASLAELTIEIRALASVVIASVNGAAIGGGCGLACVCDLAITHRDAKLGFPEVDLGLCPAVVAPWVVRKIGAGRARRVMLLGGVMRGDAAHEVGICDRVVETREDLAGATGAIVESLCTGGAMALAKTKGLCNELDGSTDPSMVREGARVSAFVLSQPEAQAILRAKFG